MSFRSPMTTRRSQQGITLVLISLIILILIGMGAFAIDLNHQVLNKARLQNAVDSAALAAAVVADDTDDFALAEEAAINALKSFVADSSGNEELAAEVEGMAGEISITFSNTKEKDSFYEAGSSVLDSEEDIYVRVAVSDVSLTQFLSRIFRDGKYVSASAVAGPSATIEGTCNVSPIGMCGDPDLADLAWGYIPSKDPDDPDYDPEAPDYNAKTDRNADTVYVLKPPGHKDGDLGTGNYHLLDFGSGKATVRELFAGYSDTCVAVGDELDTETGVAAGPVTQGLNTRFDGDDPIVIKEGNEVVETIPIKPDKYVEESNVTYENYETEYEDSETNLDSDTAFYYSDYYESLKSCEGVAGKRACKSEEYKSSGEEGRRVLRVPILDCNSGSKSSGKITDIEVLGIGCFFVTQRVDQSNSIIFGQFLDNCTVQNASTGIEPSTDSIGPYKIQLYKDPESGES